MVSTYNIGARFTEMGNQVNSMEQFPDKVVKEQRNEVANGEAKSKELVRNYVHSHSYNRE